MGENARFKNGHASVSKNARVFQKTLACRNGFWTSFLSNRRQRVGAFSKRSRVAKNALKHNRFYSGMRGNRLRVGVLVPKKR